MRLDLKPVKDLSDGERDEGPHRCRLSSRGPCHASWPVPPVGSLSTLVRNTYAILGR
jgi:hypothetical protein